MESTAPRDPDTSTLYIRHVPRRLRDRIEAHAARIHNPSTSGTALALIEKALDDIDAEGRLEKAIDDIDAESHPGLCAA